MKLPSGITNILGRQTLLLKKHAPVLMFSAGIVTAVTSTVLACQATLKLEDVVTKHEENQHTADYLLRDNPTEYSEKDHAQDMRIIRVRLVRDIAKLYAPAVGLGVVSVGLLTGAHVVLTKRNAALIAAYNLLDKGFKDYRGRVRDEFGEDKDRELFFGAVEKEVVEEGERGHEVNHIKRVAGFSVYAKPFCEGNPCWSQDVVNNRSFLQAQQNYLNDLLHARGHVMLNDAYDLLNMTRTQAGTVVGWVKNHGDNYIDFGLFNSHDPVIRDFMNLEHNDGVMIDFNVDGVVNDLIGKKY